MDPKLNSLLKWSIQNQDNTTTNNNNVVESASRGLNPEVLSSLFGGPSDADLMKAAMGALYSPDVDLENKIVAFDNFEQLIESLDNANNMESLGLWTPLVQLLDHEEADMRRMAAWCVGTAVQNNEKSQDKVFPPSPLCLRSIYRMLMCKGGRVKRPPNPRQNGHLRSRPRRAQKIRLRHLLLRPQLPARLG